MVIYSNKWYLLWFYKILELYERLRIYYYRKYDPIIVYQMGKVGSSTIYNTIKNLELKNSIYHLHFLSPNGIREAKNIHLRKNNIVVPMHIRRSELLQNHIDICKTNLKVISMVREPVGRFISDIFQNMRIFNPELFDSKKLFDYDRLLEYTQSQIKKYDIMKGFAETWFDVEFKQALNIDIFKTKFDKSKGYQIINKDNIECLILRVEDLNSVGSEALQLFLSISINIDLQQTNVGSKKNYSVFLKKLKNDISIDKNTLEYIYSSKYMKHFYSENEINIFIQKWARNSS